MILFIYSFFVLVLQGPTVGPPPPGGGYETNGGQLPIDENIWVLIAVGILFGIYIAYKRRITANKAS